MGVFLTTTGLPLLASGGLAAITAGGPAGEVAPRLAVMVGRHDYVHVAHRNEPLNLDFSGNLAGAITGISPAVPFAANGTTLTITPDGSTPTGATTYTVASGAKQTTFEMRVDAPPAKLAQSSPPRNRTVEVNRPIYVAWHRYHTGGVPPYRYEQIGGPGWAETRAGLTKIEAPGSPTSGTVTVRVTDRRGDSIELSSTTTVIAKRDRTPTYTMRAGDASIAAAVSAQKLGSGDVLYIPASLGNVSWGNMTGLVNVPTGEPPLIILGQTGATIGLTGPVISFSGCRGIILENLRVRGLAAPLADWMIKGGNDIWFYDLDVQGMVENITPDSSWQYADRFFTYANGGIHLNGGDCCVAHNCTVDKVFKAFDPRGMVIDCTIGRVRDDMFRLASSKESLVIRCTATTRTLSNVKWSEHEDIFQMFAQTGQVIHVWIEGCFLSAEGNPFQTKIADHDTWASTARDLGQMYQHMVIRENVFLGGIWNSFWFERLFDALIENNVDLLHPNVNRGSYPYAALRHTRPSTVTIRNNIIGRIDDGNNGTYRFADWQYLLRDENNIKLDVTNPAYSYTDIFPQWNNTGLPTRDRVRMNPAWAAANPGIGPAMLTGA